MNLGMEKGCAARVVCKLFSSLVLVFEDRGHYFITIRSLKIYFPKVKGLYNIPNPTNWNGRSVYCDLVHMLQLARDAGFHKSRGENG